mgnify:CR=1 FL=1
MNSQESKLKNIKMVVTDVDGVLTDGGLYYTSEGLVMKKFNVKDGMATRRLRENGYSCGIISTDGPELIEVRNKRLKMDFLITNTWNKLEKLKEICAEKSLKLENVAFGMTSRYVFEQTNLLPEQDFIAPPESYYLLGAKLSAKRQVNKLRFHFYVKGENLLNQAYRDYLNRQRYFADDLGINFIVGINAKF